MNGERADVFAAQLDFNEYLGWTAHVAGIPSQAESGVCVRATFDVLPPIAELAVDLKLALITFVRRAKTRRNA
jgi:hypothetical protein